MELEYGSLNEQLWARLPVLQEPRYTQLIGGIEAGPYIIFGVVFNRYLLDLAHEADLQSKTKAAILIEEMAAARDGQVVDLLTTEVLPTLLQNQATIDAYWPLLGSASRRKLRLIAPRLAPKIELSAIA